MFAGSVLKQLPDIQTVINLHCRLTTATKNHLKEEEEEGKEETKSDDLSLPPEIRLKNAGRRMEKNGRVFYCPLILSL